MSDILGFIPWWAWFGVLGGGGAVALAFIPGALAFVTAIFNAMPRPVKWLLLGIVAIIAANLMGRNRGYRIARDQQKANDAKATETRLEVDRKVANMKPEELDERLEKYYRD